MTGGAVGNWKPSRTARRKAVQMERAQKIREERAAKAAVRKRDRRCRFPLCGCATIGLPLEVSHDVHKGMGSKDGVSIPSLMVLLCDHRHRHGAISRHQRTLRSRYLTPDAYDGPVAWEVDINRVRKDLPTMAAWMEVARESAPGQLEPLMDWQRELLASLAEMER